MSHKHKFVVKTTNRLEYWFTCDNCGEDIMMTKWDFWDPRYYIKRRVRIDEEFARWTEQFKFMKAAREGYYDKIEERERTLLDKKSVLEKNKEVIEKEILEAEELSTKTNNWEDFDHPTIVTYHPELSRFERFTNWFWRSF